MPDWRRCFSLRPHAARVRPTRPCRFGATRNPDGQGFAAFGRVVRGMDVVRAIHGMSANGPSDSEYMRGQILTEPVAIRKAYRKPLGTSPRPAP